MWDLRVDEPILYFYTVFPFCPKCPHFTHDTYIINGILLWDPWAMLGHGREATITLHEAIWIGNETSASLKMGARVLFA